VRTPGFSGLDLARVLARLEKSPAVVFVSAYEDHAVEASEVAAVDYLLKLIVPELLADSDASARRHLSSTATATTISAPEPAALAAPAAQVDPADDLDTISAKSPA
jgi:DNA-binding LytR/AlgR family response regulator